MCRGGWPRGHVKFLGKPFFMHSVKTNPVEVHILLNSVSPNPRFWILKILWFNKTTSTDTFDLPESLREIILRGSFKLNDPEPGCAALHNPPSCVYRTVSRQKGYCESKITQLLNQFEKLLPIAVVSVNISKVKQFVKKKLPIIAEFISLCDSLPHL